MGAFMLGVVGSVSCGILRTSTPWFDELDALVISVGGGLGSLGAAFNDAVPVVDWKEIDFSCIKPDKPEIVVLGTVEMKRIGSNLRRLVLATPHSEGPNTAVTMHAVEAATFSAIDTAAKAGVRSLGIPLFATGLLSFPAAEIAAASIPAAVAAVRLAAGGELRTLQFICQDGRTETLIREAWADAFGLEGGMSTDRVDPSVGIPLSRDRLSLAPYVAMLATVIVDRRTHLPLSIGIFGEWGSGKSFFMGLLRGEVAKLAKSASPAYLDDVVQITFNAWHYSDANLWASIGDEIFRQLAGPSVGLGVDERRDQIRREMAERLGQRRELQATTDQARTEAARLRAEVDAAGVDRDYRGADLVAALRQSESIRGRLDAMWKRLGIEGEIEQGRSLAEELRGVSNEVGTFRRSVTARRGAFFGILAAAILLCFAVASLAGPTVRGWATGGGIASLATLLAGAVAVSVRARSGLRMLSDVADDLRAGVDKSAKRRHTDAVSGAVDKLRQAEANEQVSQAQLDSVLLRVGELGLQLADLTPGRRLYGFLSSRVQGDSYKSSLGLISTIRKDFEELALLMQEWRLSDEEERGYRPIDRIVLYIDDLDRCGPKQVVEVLQAVHLLLALDLFVVVVGVDPQWLLKSLCVHYDELLAAESNGETGITTDLKSTPEAYLEKILNIPFTLPGMAPGSLRDVLQGILDSDREQLPVHPLSISTSSSGWSQPVRAAVDIERDGVSIESGSEVAGQRRGVDITPRPMTESEIDLLSSLDLLVATPREFKRLINIYRMVRATRDLSSASSFLGDDRSPGEYQAVVVLLGLLTLQSRILEVVLDAQPDADPDVRGGLTHRSPNEKWVNFLADLEPRRVGPTWVNGITRTIANEDVPQWLSLRAGLQQVSVKVAVEDLKLFQVWEIRIRRFTYTLLR